MSDLRKLIDYLEHIDRGGRTTRELDPRTGRIVSQPVTEGETGRKIGSAIGGIFGKSAGDRLGQIGSNIGDIFDKSSSSDKPNASGSNKPNASGSNKPNAAAVGDISDFSSGPVATTPAGQKPNGNGDQNPSSNGSHDGSNISPDDDPENPKTWPPGIKPAPDFGYLDPNGMWIPTPFHVRDEKGDFRIPKNSPASRIGIPHNQLTPFQLAVEKLDYKSNLSSASAIEQVKPVKLPGGAPEIPGFKQVDASKFSTDAREPGLNKSLDWVYAYQKGKDFILIAPQLFYNTKISIGRHYDGWVGRGIRTDDDRVPSANGTVFVTNQHFNVNDMILSVVVHTSMGAGNIGPQILKSISGSLKPA